ncbi:MULTISPECIES: hypothetical protein [Blautia]|uniref:hypothetical protein n=1 Tax=Blautia TaxID=572511 RepID=UPI000BA34A6C|nr:MULTISPECIES: hypothetical protein [Blautia]
MTGELIIERQENEGTYIFGNKFICTNSFKTVFGSKYLDVIKESIKLINRTYSYPDYIQSLCYNEIRFFAISNQDKFSQKSKNNNYITFMMPEEV